MNFFHRFFVKLSLLFLSLLVCIVVIQVFVSWKIAETRHVEIEQLLYRHLARDMAVEIEPYLREDADMSQIGEVMHYMMVMNPKIEIYLLNEAGEILAYFAEPGLDIEMRRVDIGPIRAFLKNEENLPLYGTDPRNPDLQKHFSASPIAVGPQKEGYLYIILRSGLYDQAAAMLEEHYLLSTVNKSLLFSLPLVAIVGGFLFFFLTKRLQNVSRAVRDFENGDYERRVEIESQDEIGSLGRAFNRMADSIHSHVKELRNTDTLRRELVAGVSHDLKSPLATIQGYVETLLMKQSSLSRGQERKFLEIVLNNTQFLDRLVGELLELSRLEAKQVRPSPEVFSMTDLVQDVFMKFEPQAENRDIHLTAHMPENLCFTRADIALIERVLTNLLDNAIKHTPKHGTVTVELESADGTLRFRVSDTGEGISPEEIAHVFERFYVGSRSGSSEERGVGLGLAISKRIMELHHSTIEVESRPKEGSTFSFALPRVPAERA